MLRLFSILSPRSTALQTLVIFSTHDPKDTISRLAPEDIRTLNHFFYGQSSREGALNDLTHIVTRALMQKILSPTLIIHSREDASIPFHHAEWSLENIPNARLCESGITGHFYWIGPDYQRICESMIYFLRTYVSNKVLVHGWQLLVSQPFCGAQQSMRSTDRTCWRSMEILALDLVQRQ